MPMNTNSSSFDHYIESWKWEEERPWQIVRRRVEHANLVRHMGETALKILDAGGGNGYASLPFAQKGCQVVVADFSTEMIRDGRRRVADLGLEDRVRFVQTDLETLASAGLDRDFDVVLCNNVLQYIGDLRQVLRAILTPLKPNGLIAIIALNRYSIAYHQAFLHGNLEAALGAVNATEVTTIFQSTARALDLKEMVRDLDEAGCQVMADYGLRTMIDYWGDNQRKSDPTTLAQLEALEFALTDQYPFKLLARFFQVIARKRALG